MLTKKIFFVLFCLTIKMFGQVENEINPPYHIKTVSFVQEGNNVIPFFRLGERFEFHFDDLYGTEEDYYYTITQYNYDWTPSILAKPEYLRGVDNQRIINYHNSYNTLQQYSHYSQEFPNRFNTITKSGNYIIKIFNDEQELLFSRKFIIYEDLLGVQLSIRRPRNFETLNEKQNIELSINSGNFYLQNPIENIKVSVFQNGNLSLPLNIKRPQYTIGTELIYRYDSETQFWGSNEFYTLDTSNIRMTNNSVAMVTAGDVYVSHLYTNTPRRNNVYTFLPDFNGNFIIRNVDAIEDTKIESDYTWVYFSLDVANFFSNENIYVNGMFNNYSLTDEYKLEYNAEKKLFEKAILIKQGFVNYQYVIASKNKKINFKDAIDGNFYLTENQYDAIIYYRGNNERYDRVIGKARNNSETIRN